MEVSPSASPTVLLRSAYLSKADSRLALALTWLYIVQVFYLCTQTRHTFARQSSLATSCQTKCCPGKNKFHIIKIQLQPCTWVISKKVSHCLEEENNCIWRKRNSDVIDSSDLTFRQVFTKHMVDQSITQLWKNMYFILVPFLCKFSAKDWFIFWINEYHALFVWNTFFFADHTLLQTVLLKSIFAT